MMRVRRDPRAERAARLVLDGTRPRYAIAAAMREGKRPRRDPRAEHAAFLVPGTARRRLDRTRRPGEAELAIVSAVPATGIERAPEIRIVADPAFFVIAVLDAPGGRLTSHDRQVLGAARSLAEPSGAVVAVVPAPCEELGSAGADRAIVAASDHDYDPEDRT